MELPKRFITNDSGGSLFAKSHDGLAEVAMTDYGEIMLEILEGGELMTFFSNLGLTCIYLDGGKLGTASIELVTYLDLQFRNHKLDPQNHPGLYSLVEKLKSEKLTCFISAYPTLGEFDTRVIDRNGKEVSAENFENLDFTYGIYGTVEIWGVEVAYQFMNNPDEMTLAIGDKDPETRMLAVAISRNLDYIDDVTSGDSHRFQRIAKKIILD